MGVAALSISTHSDQFMTKEAIIVTYPFSSNLARVTKACRSSLCRSSSASWRYFCAEEMLRCAPGLSAEVRRARDPSHPEPQLGCVTLTALTGYYNHQSSNVLGRAKR